MASESVLLWLRQDLRLADNPALDDAVRSGLPVVPVLVWAPEEEGRWAPGAASRWWLHHALADLEAQLGHLGSRLVFRRGPTVDTLLALARECGARLCVWNHRYEPAVTARDAQLREALEAAGVQVRLYHGSLLRDPATIRTAGGGPYQVFTPYWRRCLDAGEPREPLPAPRALRAPAAWPRGLTLNSLALLPRIAWDAGLQAAWRPGTAGAHEALTAFLKTGLSSYAGQRDAPAVAGTSRLSPHLHVGTLSPHQIWHAARARLARDGTAAATGADPYGRQLLWREFAHALLHHFPRTADEPLRREYLHFPWRPADETLTAWQQGRTGYPIVDAAMRELWHTGWMHNRARMIVASFLVKDLLLSWQEGARWFWDTLVDADLANNTLGWQWAGGCGADAAPYFRVFNPVLQGEKFDPRGTYVRRFVPELARLDVRWLHQPWRAPSPVLASAGIRLGQTYPMPLVDHAQARQRALAALKAMPRRGLGSA